MVADFAVHQLRIRRGCHHQDKSIAAAASALRRPRMPATSCGECLPERTRVSRSRNVPRPCARGCGDSWLVPHA
jgi:hypothetical protein